MNLLVFNLKTDANDTALGFTTSWVNRIAEDFDRVFVVTMQAGDLRVAPNVSVHSLGKEHGRPEWRRLISFYAIVGQLLRRHRIDVCFAHMTPLFTSLFGPVARATGVPVLLWYAHGNVTRELRIAHWWATRCATSTSSGFRLPSDKLFVLGQGIDTDLFAPPEAEPEGYARTVVSIGRLTPRKRTDEVLEAFALARGELGGDASLVLVGEPLTAEDQEYARRLRERADRDDLRGAVRFTGPVPYTDIPAQYHRGAILFNLSETGSLDKAILEGMASGCIPVSRNESFARIAEERGFTHLVPDAGAEAAAATLVRALRMDAGERHDLSGRLRQVVAEDHSLDRLGALIVEHLRSLARGARNGRRPAA